MYLRRLHVERLKLVRDMALDFTDTDGKSIRKWTVIIGKNGTGKSSLLQAVALAAAGSLQVNTLAGRTVGHLRDRRSSESMNIVAQFELIHRQDDPRLQELVRGAIPEVLVLLSRVGLEEGETSIRGSSQYLNAKWFPKTDPLDSARSRNTPRWFVAGYGVARFMPDVGRTLTLDRPSIERMLPLFDATASLTSTNFSSYFSDDEGKAARFQRALKRVLLHVESLLPDIVDFDLRGRGGVTGPGDLQERHTFWQRVGTGVPLKVPGVALAHGYHSTIAWLADLVGHVVLETDADIEPDEMEGVVLVDEIDSYLHPAWQASIIPALRATFPKMQFIVTTHSPVVLSGVAPHEVVRLASWGDTGDVLEVVHHPETGELVPAALCRDSGVRPDARMMTGTEILGEHFGLERAMPNPMGADLRRFTMLAADPFRTDAEHAEMLRLQKALRAHELTELSSPVRRKKS